MKWKIVAESIQVQSHYVDITHMRAPYHMAHAKIKRKKKRGGIMETAKVKCNSKASFYSCHGLLNASVKEFRVKVSAKYR